MPLRTRPAARNVMRRGRTPSAEHEIKVAPLSDGLGNPVEPQIRPILFTQVGMSARNNPDQVAIALAGRAGVTIGDARHGRRWTLRELSERSGVSPSMLHAIEHGAPASLLTYAAVAAALGLEPRLDLIDPRRRATARAEDPVHAAMGERIAAPIAAHGLPVAIDEPYQQDRKSTRLNSSH